MAAGRFAILRDTRAYKHGAWDTEGVGDRREHRHTGYGGQRAQVTLNTLRIGKCGSVGRHPPPYQAGCRIKFPSGQRDGTRGDAVGATDDMAIDEFIESVVQYC